MSEENRNFKSHGKFLITAEYLILKGAVGLALPLKRGQKLTIQPNHTDFIQWESSVLGKTWFECKVHIKDLKVISTTNEEISNSLVNVLGEARNLNPAFIETGIIAKIDADFNLQWGLGSSSTLINNVAEWAKVDPYALLEKTFGGSGYDIACAAANGPITYQLNFPVRSTHEVNFHPAFANHIFFVYLGKKMNSRTGMSYFKEKAKYGEKEIQQINLITQQIISSKSLNDFEDLLNEHERLMAEILQIPTVKSSNFDDYSHTVKSMGAWGGDFVLVTGHTFEEVKTYFNSKGLDTVIPYNDIVLS